MTWDGSAPEEPTQFRPKLLSGYHRVRLTKVVELESGDFLAILSSKSGEAAEYIPQDIRPRSKEEREEAKKRGERLSDWRFWRFVGAFDYPSPEHWETEPHLPRKWSAGTDLEEIQAQGKECWIEVSQWWNRNKKEWVPSVESMKSLARHDIGALDPGPGGFIPKPDDPVSVPEPEPDNFSNEEVPF